MSAPALLDPVQPAPAALHSLREEVDQLARLAAPVAIASVGQLTMGLVDTWMVGGLGPAALGGVSLGDSLFFTFVVVALGTVQAVETLVSQATGAQDPARARSAWRTGQALAIGLALPLLVLAMVAPRLIALLGLDHEVARLTVLYLEARATSVPFMLLFAADRAFLFGQGSTRPVMVSMLVANVANVILCWGLIYGNLGMPPLGVAGAGYATASCTVLNWMIVRTFAVRSPIAPGAATFGRELVAKTLRLGVPIGLSHGSEVGAFALAALFMGWLGTAPLAAHQVAIKMASTSFMLAVAIGTATSVRVGQSIGARRPEDAARAGRVGVGLGLLVMASCGVLFAFAGRRIAGTFTDDPAVIELGAALLVVAAAFQLSDGSQAILAGALRGAGDTGFPFWANLAAYYAVALPIAWTLAFPLGAGPVAVWWALALGLTGSAALLAIRFSRVVHRAVPV